jgi:hypothetical protein
VLVTGLPARDHSLVTDLPARDQPSLAQVSAAAAKLEEDAVAAMAAQDNAAGGNGDAAGTLDTAADMGNGVDAAAVRHPRVVPCAAANGGHRWPPPARRAPPAGVCGDTELEGRCA